MMPQGHKYLFDIKRAIELIEEFMRDTPTFTAYQTDLKTRSAVERQSQLLAKP